METIDYAFNLDFVKRLGTAWPRRATVRSDFFEQLANAPLDSTAPDYPAYMVPFWDHPTFASVSDKTREAVLAWAWIVYNRRTIAAEERVANPAFALLVAGRFPCGSEPEVQQQIQHSLIDEHFHSLMHMMAIERTRKMRGIDYEIQFPDSVTYRALQRLQAQTQDPWERDLQVLVFAIVSEISINAYLELMARDSTIQPFHSLITTLHNRDEYAHAALLAEISKPLYGELNEAQRASFRSYLPVALDAFWAQDYSAWECILRHLQVPHYAEMLEDCKRDASKSKLSRDYSGLEKLVTELGIKEELNFQFAA
ncbi:diiron oxygenase [Burkholderia sp. 22PA0099]|uniref:diiron oxygenase n=1 Tax=Burkholderia sp. 22PA0099 TaxID=3237372 RepID=UPI0039C1A566